MKGTDGVQKRAVRIVEPGGPDVLELRPVDLPPPAAGEVGISVRAAGLNRADLLQRRGLYPPPPGAPSDIPGLEVAGVVESPGSGVDSAATGDRVMALVSGGGYAERINVSARMLIPIPERLSFVEAAALPEAFLTAHDVFLQAGLDEGERVLVHAAGGGVGTAALQLARLAGASLVIGTASKGKLSALEERGLPLDVAVDYEREAFAETVARETGGEGVHVILDAVGASYWEDNLRSLAMGGRLVVVGLLGGARTEVDLGALMRRRARVIGTVLRSRPLVEKIALRDRFCLDLLPGLQVGRLVPVVDRVYPLAKAATAHRYMEENRNVGKVVLEVG